MPAKKTILISLALLMFGLVSASFSQTDAETDSNSSETSVVNQEGDNSSSSGTLDRTLEQEVGAEQETPQEEEGVVYCPICGHANGIYSRYCSYCGAMLLGQDSNGVLYRYCIYCGTKNSPEAKKCKVCGFSFVKPFELTAVSEMVWRRSYEYALKAKDLEKQAMIFSPIFIGGGLAVALALRPGADSHVLGMVRFFGMCASTIGVMRIVVGGMQYNKYSKYLEELHDEGIEQGYIDQQTQEVKVKAPPSEVNSGE
jgi:hypothetical protein